MAGGVRVVVIHVLLTAFDGDGLLHIIGAASSAFRSGACLCTLEYILVSELVFVGGKAGGPGGSSTNSAGGLVPNFGSSSDGLPFRGRGIAKFLISFLQFFTACQGKDDTFPVSQSELVLYFDSHNAKLCQFYSQCVPTPLDRHDTKTVKGRIRLASFFCQPCPELKPFLLRKRELHLEIGYLKGNIHAVAGPTIGDDANAVGANATLQECLRTCQNFDAYIDDESWCINNVSDPLFKSLTTLSDERRRLPHIPPPARRRYPPPPHTQPPPAQ